MQHRQSLQDEVGTGLLVKGEEMGILGMGMGTAMGMMMGMMMEDGDGGW